MGAFEIGSLLLVGLICATVRSHPTLPSEPGDELLPGWNEAPSSLDDYYNHGEIIIDPWSYLQRLGLFKIMLNATENYMPLFKRTLAHEAGKDPENLGNMLWGLPIQFSWQMESGRLQDFIERSLIRPTSHRDEDVEFSSEKILMFSEPVSCNSWWASMNYYLSVLPFLGAINSGLINSRYPIIILPPQSHSDDFCLSIKECTAFVPEALEHWTEFFEEVLRQSGLVVVPTLAPREDLLLELIWRAHMSSLHSVIDKFGEVLALMPEPEQQLGLSWANLVDYVAAARFELDYNTTYLLNDLLLPPRVLEEGDRAPFISDLSIPTNIAIWTMETMYTVDENKDDVLKKLFNQMMCTGATRADARYVIDHLFEDPWKLLPKLPGFIYEILTDCFLPDPFFVNYKDSKLQYVWSLSALK